MHKCIEPWLGIIPPPPCPGCPICQPEVNRKLWTKQEILEALEEYRKLIEKSAKKDEISS